MMTHYLLMLIQTICRQNGDIAAAACHVQSSELPYNTVNLDCFLKKLGSDQCYNTGNISKSRRTTSLLLMLNMYVALDEYYLMHCRM